MIDGHWSKWYDPDGDMGKGSEKESDYNWFAQFSFEFNENQSRNQLCFHRISGSLITHSLSIFPTFLCSCHNSGQKNAFIFDESKDDYEYKIESGHFQLSQCVCVCMMIIINTIERLSAVFNQLNDHLKGFQSVHILGLPLIYATFEQFNFCTSRNEMVLVMRTNETV